ncbi:MAG: hypothetical protein IIC87_05440 [Chloroflexi bacterium]|nr:hypothetical protein [Chloroflexota bacterium]
MSIEDRNLATGTKLVAQYKGHEYRCVVVTGEGDKPGYKMECPDHPDLDGREFKSPSSAGSAVMGGSACNGWRFWSLEGQEPKPKAKAKEAQSADFRRIPGGRAWCNGCAAAFKVEAGTTPTVCPEGHTP